MENENKEKQIDVDKLNHLLNKVEEEVTTYRDLLEVMMNEILNFYDHFNLHIIMIGKQHTDINGKVC